MKTIFIILAAAFLITSCSKTQDQINKDIALEKVKDIVGDKFKLISVKSISSTIADAVLMWNEMYIPESEPKLSDYDYETIDRYIYNVEYRVDGVKKSMSIIKWERTKYCDFDQMLINDKEYDGFVCSEIFKFRIYQQKVQNNN